MEPLLGEKFSLNLETHFKLCESMENLPRERTWFLTGIELQTYNGRATTKNYLHNKLLVYEKKVYSKFDITLTLALVLYF